MLVAVLRSSGQDLAAAEETITAVPALNSYRHLAFHALADRLRSAGEDDRAAEVRAQASSLRPKIAAARDADSAAALKSYWECQERADRREIRSLLEHHRYVERIDARVFGLPADDFDDQKNLTIPERLFLRAHARDQGWELATSGPVQYHREARHFLRKIQQRSGSFIDCSGTLAALDDGPPRKDLGEDGSEVKLEEDNDADNEVNVVVNPYDPRYVVATSNPTGSGGNEVYRSSNWAESWTNGTATVANNCCDPVSYYNRTEVGGVPTDVLYHSTLVDTAGGGVRSRMIYSTDNGASWSDCGTNIGSGDRDARTTPSTPIPPAPATTPSTSATTTAPSTWPPRPAAPFPTARAGTRCRPASPAPSARRSWFRPTAGPTTFLPSTTPPAASTT